MFRCLSAPEATERSWSVVSAETPGAGCGRFGGGPSACDEEAPVLRGRRRLLFVDTSAAFAALKAAGTCEAAMAKASPVCGFRPVRAAPSLVVNFPKPATATVSPRATAAAMTENMAAAAAEAVVRGKTTHEKPLGACPWSFAQPSSTGSHIAIWLWMNRLTSATQSVR